MPIYCVELFKTISFRCYVDAPDGESAVQLVRDADDHDDIDDHFVDGSGERVWSFEEVDEDEVYERVEDGIDFVHNVDSYPESTYKPLSWE